MSAHLDGDQLIATRHLDAGLALVWEVFTTPAHLAAFWGGHHATFPAGSVRVDLRAGGRLEIGTLSFRYELVQEPRRLVLSEPTTGILTDIRLDPAPGGGTTITVHQRHLPPELRTGQARAGLAGILDKLHELTTRLEGPR